MEVNEVIKITRGRLQLKPRILIYGTEGIGKSTFASQAPKPIFVQTEDGIDGLDADRFPLATDLETVIFQLEALANSENPYETVVVDSIDWLERLIVKFLTKKYKVETVDSVGGGYAKYRKFVQVEWDKIVAILNTLRSNGKTIILIAHAGTQRIEDPETAAYDKFTPRLEPGSAAFLSEWADVVGFAYQPKIVVKQETLFSKTRNTARPIGDNTYRRLRIVGSPFCIAKNRYGIVGDSEGSIGLNWSELMENITQNSTVQE